MISTRSSIPMAFAESDPSKTGALSCAQYPRCICHSHVFRAPILSRLLPERNTRVAQRGGLRMALAIKEVCRETGRMVGLKVAGGVTTPPTKPWPTTR